MEKIKLRTCVYEQMHANQKKLPYTVISKNQYIAINIPAPGFQAGGQLVLTDGGGGGGGWSKKGSLIFLNFFSDKFTTNKCAQFSIIVTSLFYWKKIQF